MNRKLLALTALLCFTFMVSTVQASANVRLDYVDIGDEKSEFGHFLVGWGPIEPAHSGGSYGGVSNCRCVYVATCSDKPWAKLVLYTPEGAAKTLKMRVLDGIADDSFDVYVKKPDKKWVLVYSYKAHPGPGDWKGTAAEVWVEHTMSIPPKVAKGTIIKVKIVLTADTTKPWWGFETYGWLAIDWIELWGNGKPR
jgi:hypothetical protein